METIVAHIADKLEKRAFKLMKNHNPQPPLEEFRGDEDISWLL